MIIIFDSVARHACGPSAAAAVTRFAGSRGSWVRWQAANRRTGEPANLRNLRTNMIDVIQADITTLEVDAIVNAANERMLGGGGVDGAIHRAAGRRLYRGVPRGSRSEPRRPVSTGQSRITPAFNLSARHVIHTVGPIWRGGASRSRVARVVLPDGAGAGAPAPGAIDCVPAISCGVYGYPLEEAAAIAGA